MQLQHEHENVKKEKEALEATCAGLRTANGQLEENINKQEQSISTLSGNKRELEQILVKKIKEHDFVLREVAEKEQQVQLQIKESTHIHDAFFVDTIHEMRTPLSLILGSLSLIVQKKSPEEDMSSQLLSAYRNTLALQDLADQLTGTRFNKDVSTYLRIARYDLIEIVRQSCDLFVDWVEMNNVDLRVNTQTEHLWIWLDRRKFEYSLRTLLTNAFKNTFSYGKIALTISVVREQGRSYCMLSVQDEGLGESEGARRGLKQVVDLMDDIGGRYAQEVSDAGAAYTLHIPLGKQHLLDKQVEFVEPEADLVKLNETQKAEIAEFIRIVPTKRTNSEKKLLVIDDSDQIRWFLKQVFGKEYQMLEARNGEEGVTVALEQQPDLILCDVMMPLKDGFAVCLELKQDPRTAHTPIVMLTAKVESQDVVNGIESGADDYITKPFDIEILRTKISGLLKRREELWRHFTHTAGTDEEAKEADTNSSLVANSPFMEAVIKNIEKYLDDSTFEAKILADSLNMSLPTLYRKIKQHSNCSILELTRTVRLNKAAELIRTQRHSVQEVAELVGFNDTATFRKRFTEQYGITPSQYGQPS